MVKEAFLIKLVETREIAPQVKHFVFKYTGSEAFTYIPGQFITLLLEQGEKVLRRSYSLASCPDLAHHHIEFAASYVENGTASEFLFSLKAGDTIKATGPFGRLILPPEPEKRYILIATGTGVTPYRAMLSVLAEAMQTQACEVLLLQGTRHLEEVLYKDEFLAFASQHEHFTYRACLSRLQEVPQERYLFKGYVQDCLAGMQTDPEADLVYLCGNPNMVDATFKYLTDAGFATKRIKREKYISSK